MADVTFIIRALERYLAVLEEQRAAAENALRRVGDRYDHLSARYGGNAADEFKRAWRQAQEALAEHTEGSRALIIFINERLTVLRQMDRDGF